MPLVAALLVALACRTVPVAPAGESGRAAAAGISVHLRGPLGFPTYAAQSVYFLPRCAFANACEGRLRDSSWSSGGRVYWLNAPPDHYVAVAASFKVFGAPDVYLIYFPEALVERTAIQVTDGQFAYAGTYVLSMDIGICPEHASATQVAIARELGLRMPGCGLAQVVTDKLLSMMLVSRYGSVSRVFQYRGGIVEAQRSDGDRVEFLDRAREDLAGSGWRVTAR